MSSRFSNICTSAIHISIGITPPREYPHDAGQFRLPIFATTPYNLGQPSPVILSKLKNTYTYVSVHVCMRTQPVPTAYGWGMLGCKCDNTNSSFSDFDSNASNLSKPWLANPRLGVAAHPHALMVIAHHQEALTGRQGQGRHLGGLPLAACGDRDMLGKKGKMKGKRITSQYFKDLQSMSHDLAQFIYICGCSTAISANISTNSTQLGQSVMNLKQKEWPQAIRMDVKHQVPSV